ncbi:hypothetical protein EX30DRAFT_337952 [Ascodesmis nigricans]|uniref:Uncharacterized protein n=1 Tax=Ascodesmis nigricans TaxID=341454 RepID=A0A4S2N8A2_9PEZI|nr:hypothetical protein EX30DRAFT_337952 [Ascodesmis nigricans]
MLHRGRGRSATGSGSVEETPGAAGDGGQRKRGGEQGRHSEEVGSEERPMTGESHVSGAGRQHSQPVDPEILEREWEEQEEQRLRSMEMDARDRER